MAASTPLGLPPTALAARSVVPPTGAGTAIGPSGMAVGLRQADPNAAHEAAVSFESEFLSQMLGYMWEGVEPDETFGGGQGEEVFRSLLVNEYGKAIARSGGLGIAAAVRREILKAQEA
jgi:Rod binding domain-containing protein